MLYSIELLSYLQCISRHIKKNPENYSIAFMINVKQAKSMA
jgi:hypothetical protein